MIDVNEIREISERNRQEGSANTEERLRHIRWVAAMKTLFFQKACDAIGKAAHNGLFVCHLNEDFFQLDEAGRSDVVEYVGNRLGAAGFVVKHWRDYSLRVRW